MDLTKQKHTLGEVAVAWALALHGEDWEIRAPRYRRKLYAAVWRGELKAELPRATIFRALPTVVPGWPVQVTEWFGRDGKATVDWEVLAGLQSYPESADKTLAAVLVDKDDWRKFAVRQHPRPRIWPLPDRPPPGSGRIPEEPAYFDELRRRWKRRELEPTLAAESRYLARWHSRNYPDQKTPNPESLANRVRKEFRRLTES